jgi:GINS complex subunit 4
MEDNTAEISKTVDDLMLSIYQMDISRTTFLLKAYLRTRLGKIENFVMHIIRTPELWERLSEQEQGYAQRWIH